MRKTCFFVLNSALTVIGSIVGAGFVTGSEIYEFYSKDFSVFGIVVSFLMLVTALYFSYKIRLPKLCNKVFSIVVSLCNFIVFSGMLSCFQEVLCSLFHISEKVIIFKVLSAIFIIFTIGENIDIISKITIIEVPLVLMFLVVSTLIYGRSPTINLIPYSLCGTVYPMLYVGYNVLLCSQVLSKLKENMPTDQFMPSAILTSLILSCAIFVIAKSMISFPFTTMSPIQSMFSQNSVLNIIYCIVMLSAIITSMISSAFSTFRVLSGKYYLMKKTVVVFSALWLSGFGFDSIVSKLYPVLGVVGVLYICFILFLSIFFHKEQPRRTFRLPRNKE